MAVAVPENKAPERIVIATRASRLALWQAEHVRDRLRALYPACDVSLLTMTTRGDQILDRSLSKIGGKGLFIKELETALIDGRADLAVHSLKDVPVDLDPVFSLAAILDRDDPRDAFVSNDYASLDDVPAGSVIGTSSLRREAQLRSRYPGLVVQPLRGNLDTRLGKLDRGEYAGIILAAAGLRRMGMASRIRSVISPDQSLPAAGQGALGIETLNSRADMKEWLAPLVDSATLACATAERAVSSALGGSCQVPLAAFAELRDGALNVKALVAEPDGSRVLTSSAQGSPDQAEALGRQAAQALREQGADAILARLLAANAQG